MRTLLPRRLILLTLAHFTIDSYSSFFLPLLPLLVGRLGLDYTRVGGLVALGSMSSSFAQPLFGLVADRLGRPWFLALGPLVAAVFIAPLGGAPTYLALVSLLVAGGIGVAMFHPQTASLAGASGRNRALAMSVWVSGGSLGWALGPLFATTTVQLVGLSRTWLAATPGVLIALVLLAWLRRLPVPPRAERRAAPLAELAPVARPLALLYTVVVMRSAVSTGFATFLPLYLVRERHWSLAAGTLATTIYLVASAIGGFGGGWLADRFGGRRVVRASFALAIPFYVLFFVLPERAGLACLIVGYAFMQGSLPVNVILGQELSPRHASTISSLLMGAAWGIGSLLVGPVGALADRAGLRVALMALASLILLGLACSLALPPSRPRVLESGGQPA